MQLVKSSNLARIIQNTEVICEDLNDHIEWKNANESSSSTDR